MTSKFIWWSLKFQINSKDVVAIVNPVGSVENWHSHWVNLWWGLEPSKFSAVLISPWSGRTISNGCVFDSISSIVKWTDTCFNSMLFQSNKLVHKWCRFDFVHHITQSNSISVLNWFNKNISKEEGKIAISNLLISSHSGHNLFSSFSILQCFLDLVCNILNGKRAEFSTVESWGVDLLVKSPEVFNWIDNTWWWPRGKSNLWVSLSKPSWHSTWVWTSNNNNFGDTSEWFNKISKIGESLLSS